jgi:hypothetical protein
LQTTAKTTPVSTTNSSRLTRIKMEGNGRNEQEQPNATCGKIGEHTEREKERKRERERVRERERERDKEREREREREDEENNSYTSICK